MIITEPIVRGGGREVIIGNYLIQSIAGTDYAERNPVTCRQRVELRRQGERKVVAVGDAGRVIDFRV